jgi:membrane-associated phospholipid phosphatase
MASGWKRPLQLALACWVPFAALLVLAYWVPLGKWADARSVEGFKNLQRPWLDDTASLVARLANPKPFVVATVVLVGIALYRRRPRQAIAVIVLLVGANVLTQVLKIILAHPRHHDFLGRAQLGTDAFPSGHATASMALALAAVLVAPRAWRPVVAIAGSLFALGVSESIMLLAWHYPSDVAAGYLVATSSALATVAALRAANQRWPERAGRDAAKRAIRQVDPRFAALVVAGFAFAAVGALSIAGGERALHFADQHTASAVAAFVVAAMAAALPVSVAALGTRRP